MPAISNSFNRYLWILPGWLSLISGALAQIPSFNEEHTQWLGEQLFLNECGARFECLTSWNPGENFPSLGIGHFIWYQAEQSEPFEETFPGLLAFYDEQQVALPVWLREPQQRESPWVSREQFMAQQDSPRLRELRTFLAATKDVQSDYISRRLERSLQEILRRFQAQQRAEMENRIYSLASSHPPLGLYALIDYVHFKGTGLNQSERYRDQGWGLLQVLQQMQSSAVSLENFVASAEIVLQRRVDNAPVERNEQRWLAGWVNRLQTYLPLPSLLSLSYLRSGSSDH